MKERHKDILKKVRNENEFNPHKYLEELEYLDDKGYLDVIVKNNAERYDNNISDGELIGNIEKDQYSLDFKNIELNRPAIEILVEGDRHRFRNKLLGVSAVLSAVVSLLVAYITTVTST